MHNTKDLDSLKRIRPERDQSLAVPGIFLRIPDPSIGLGLVNSLPHGAVLLPRASQTALVLKN